MGITFSLNTSGVRETLAAFKALPKEASAALRDANQHISDGLATKIRAAARGSSRQSAAVAVSVDARRDRVPNVVAGQRNPAVTSQSRRSKGQGPTRVSDLLFGSNFGASQLKQFRPHTGAGQDDYWFFRTVESSTGDVVRQWNDAVDEVLDQWGAGG
jgi:hypothetical protein